MKTFTSGPSTGQAQRSASLSGRVIVGEKGVNAKDEATGRDYITVEVVSGVNKRNLQVFLSYDKDELKPLRENGTDPNSPRFNNEGLSALHISPKLIKAEGEKILHLDGIHYLDPEKTKVEARRVSVTGNRFVSDRSLGVTSFKDELGRLNVYSYASKNAEPVKLSGDLAARRDQAVAAVKAAVARTGENEGVTILINGGSEGEARVTLQKVLSRFEGLGQDSKKISNEELEVKAIKALTTGNSFYSYDGKVGATIDDALNSGDTNVIVVPSERVNVSKKMSMGNTIVRPGIGSLGYGIHDWESPDQTIVPTLSKNSLEAAGLFGLLSPNMANQNVFRPQNHSAAFNRIAYQHANLNGLEAPVVLSTDPGHTVAQAQSAAQASASSHEEPSADAQASAPLSDSDFDGDFGFDNEPDPFEGANAPA